MSNIIFRSQIIMGNHAFVENDGDYRYELAKCLRELAERMEGEEIVKITLKLMRLARDKAPKATGFIKDTNGNSCGAWEIKEVDDKIRITTNLS